MIAFAGELLSKAEQLLKLGLHTADVIEGYEVARAKVLEIVEGLMIFQKRNLEHAQNCRRNALRTPINQKSC